MKPPGVSENFQEKDAESIPIIAMTADAFAEDVQRAQDAGMNAHVAKPRTSIFFIRYWLTG